MTPTIGEDGETFAEQPRRRRRDVGNAPEIENQKRRIWRLAGEPARDVIYRREIERADQLDHADVAVVLVENLLLVRLPAATGGNRRRCRSRR